MESAAGGRTAEVFAVDEDRVLKLDYPEWNGASHYEGGVLRAASSAGLPVPEVFELVTVEGRQGIVIERIHGVSLSTFLTEGGDIDTCADEFVDLHSKIQEIELPCLPDLVPRLRDEINRSGLSIQQCSDLSERLTGLAQGEPSRVCHFDLHPDNIMVSGGGWMVIDWLTAANGPPIADLARTLLLRADTRDPTVASFMGALTQCEQDRRGFDAAALRSWTPLLAAARLAEGFAGAYADWLVGLATQNRLVNVAQFGHLPSGKLENRRTGLLDLAYVGRPKFGSFSAASIAESKSNDFLLT